MSILWRIVRFTRQLWPYYLGVSLFSILIAAMSQLVPLLTKAAIDEISKAGRGEVVSVNHVILLAVLIFATDIGQTLFSNIGGYIGDQLGVRQQRLLSKRYYQQILRLPQRYFDNELTGTVINRLNRGVNQISEFTQTFSNNFLQFLFSSVFTLVIVAYYSWPVAIILFLMYPVFVWLTAITNDKWQAWQKDINASSDRASGRFAESVAQIRVVKSYGQQLRELKLFGTQMNKMVATTKPQSRYWHRNDIIRRVVLAIMNVAMYGFIFIQTANGHYNIGTMVLLIQYAQLMRIPLFSISYLVSATQRTIGNSRDYFAVMDEQPEQTTSAQPDLVIKRGTIEFDDVAFGYDEDKSVLRDLSFTMAADTKTALVGESGQGKTTITNLLLRLYDVDSGRITIDGTDITKVNRNSLRQRIAVVFQEPALFSGTIRENIAYARPNASDAEVEAAATAANAHEFISDFEKGYASEIGERGLKLSGGQKQRIAIARALLKDAPILILDEATSSLDTKSERLVQQALDRLMKGRTTLLIAHRLSTIEAVDTIVTIRNGTVGEIGSPAELAQGKGIYAQLLRLQAGSESAREQLKQYEIDG